MRSCLVQPPAKFSPREPVLARPLSLGASRSPRLEPALVAIVMVAPAQPRRTIHQPAFRPGLESQVTVSQVVGADGRRIPGDSLEQLEQLDDTVFAALGGDAHALDEAARAWHEAQTSVDPRLLDESRREYVRRARSRWRGSQRQPAERLATGFAALEILGLLSNDAAA